MAWYDKEDGWSDPRYGNMKPYDAINISTLGVAPLFWAILGLSDNKDVLQWGENIEEKTN